jgi:hypothetical protein
METARKLLRHSLAAIAYRTHKAIRGAPHDFGEFRAAAGVRTPQQILRHMSDVLGYASTFYAGDSGRALSKPSFHEEVDRFYEVLGKLREHIIAGELNGTTPERLLQGPLADALTHTGQLAMLRRMAGSPIPPENFIEADIVEDRVGYDQPPPVSPDEDWFDAETEPY